MKLVSFQVRTFRNVVDSGEIEVDDDVICLVGKNEAGKSALLEALYLLNPSYGEVFDVDDQYPKWLLVQDRRQGDPSQRVPITATFELSSSDSEALECIVGPGVLTGNQVRIERAYNGALSWDFSTDETAAVQALVSQFPDQLKAQTQDVGAVSDLHSRLQSLEQDDEENDESPEEGDEDDDESLERDDEGDLSGAIQAAWEVIDSAGLREFGLDERIIGLLEEGLPVFFRFTNYSTLPGRVDMRTLSSSENEGPASSASQTARALLKLAQTTAEDIAQEGYESRRGELDAVQIDLTNQVFEYWKQNTELEVAFDVEPVTTQQPNGENAVIRYLQIRLKDRRTGYSNNFSQRSSGFQWFFSFFAAFSEFEDDDRSVMVLLDEPALSLHGRAQGDFLRFINDRLAPTSQVLYTTHSPFMVEAERLERVRIVEDQGPPLGATASNEVLASDPDSLFPLQAALGYDIAQNLFIGPHNLVVEGTSDFIFATVLTTKCLASGRTGLDDRWRMLPAGGATNIPTFVSLIGPHVDVTVLVDSDTKGMQRVTGMTERGLLASQRLIHVSSAADSQEADIEDLFSVDDYLDLYNRTFDTGIMSSELPQGDRITKRLEKLSGRFDHGRVAETLLRDQESALTDVTLDRFAALFQAINSTMEL